jgi:transcriptional regulator with XRE-family HTH domain
MGFGENVRQLRLDAGYRHAKDLAAILGISASVLSRWELNRTGLPETPTLLNIAKTLGVDVNRLLKDVDPAYDEIVNRETESDAAPMPAHANAPSPADISGTAQALPPVVDDGEDVDASHPSERLFRIANEILEVGEDIESWRSPAMARRSGPEVSSRPRQNRKSPRQKPAQKSSRKRR